MWTGGINGNGYGQVKRDGRWKRAHRVAYETFYGPIPDGLLVCHTCDVRACVNPHHLYLGTHLDNNQDTVSRKRRAETPIAIYERVIELYRTGDYLQKEIATLTGYSQPHISRIIRTEERWREGEYPHSRT